MCTFSVSGFWLIEPPVGGYFCGQCVANKTIYNHFQPVNVFPNATGELESGSGSGSGSGRGRKNQIVLPFSKDIIGVDGTNKYPILWILRNESGRDIFVSWKMLFVKPVLTHTHTQEMIVMNRFAFGFV